MGVNIVIYRIVSIFFEIIEIAILIEVLLSWIPNGRNSKIGRIVRVLTEPIMAPAEKINDRFLAGFVLDFSPIIAYFLIFLIRRIILSILVML